MSKSRPSRPLLSLVLAAGLSASAALYACPAGQSEVCLGGCICVADPDGVFGVLQEDARNVAAPALAQWLSQSRERMVAAGVQPLPLDLRVQLQAWYPDDLLQAVRYRVGQGQDVDAASAMLQNQDVVAVTLIDVVVFRNEDDALHNLALWAHELKHVQQYRELGVDGFARQYVRNFSALEDPAYAIQNQVSREVRSARAPAGD
ncbi:MULTISPECIES: DUF4157 domain-containing protein [unclassified Pseudomonas]|uniref:eCIS core domain-containing protein n=1 Tax=unclassified Pseudomonas TaxID=196821 RepID=UPI00073146C5|nr:MULTISPECIES: DUF4157 domain-containing protein [unclassified Pseudomonas]KSW27671.1 hypothetical protein AOX63_29405 [Pseudomonas sp. ADP]OBP07119.1 hypothetical protein BAE52_30800 [Pseudomonas sp. EGD-AKN5]